MDSEMAYFTAAVAGSLGGDPDAVLAVLAALKRKNDGGSYSAPIIAAIRRYTYTMSINAAAELPGAVYVTASAMVRLYSEARRARRGEAGGEDQLLALYGCVVRDIPLHVEALWASAPPGSRAAFALGHWSCGVMQPLYEGRGGETAAHAHVVLLRNTALSIPTWDEWAAGGWK